MLAPQDRLSIYDIVRPPAGWAFDAMAVCAYSASLETVLSLPAALLADAPGTARPVAGHFSHLQLAALRRTCDRTLIFCQQGALHGAEKLPPAVIEAERMVHAVTAPGGGAFHPKVWVVRFADEKGRRRVRLAVTSRNLTGDRSWDAGVVMEGGETRRPAAGPVGELLRALPERCARPLTAAQTRLLSDLADATDATAWRPPPDFSGLALHVIGLGKTWAPPPSDRLIVASPFLDTPALDALARTSGRRLMLISRPEALDRTWGAAAKGYERRTVLAAPEDNTVAAPPGELHAKIYAWDKGARSRFALGSMNATTAALGGANVEFMAEFDCTRRLRGAGVAALVEGSALEPVLEEYAPPAGEETAGEAADDRPARRALWSSGLHLACASAEDGWRVALCAESGPKPQLAALLPNLTFRPATLSRDEAAPCLEALSTAGEAVFPRVLQLAEITGFVVFEADGAEGPIYFTLGLDVRGVSEDERRHAALRTLLPTQQSFVDLVRILLGDPAPLEGGGASGWGDGDGGPAAPAPAPTAGLLELLVRCAADDPDRLVDIEATLKSFSEEELARIAPREFRVLWEDLSSLIRSRR